MVELAYEKIKLGGLFSKRVEVIYEMKLTSMTESAESMTIEMYNSNDGNHIGRLDYSREGPMCKLAAFNIDDWTTTKFAERLMKRFISMMKKKGVKKIETELYDTDNKTHFKINLYKTLGFGVVSGGNITGYNQYYLEKII